MSGVRRGGGKGEEDVEAPQAQPVEQGVPVPAASPSSHQLLQINPAQRPRVVLEQGNFRSTSGSTGGPGQLRQEAAVLLCCLQQDGLIDQAKALTVLPFAETDALLPSTWPWQPSSAGRPQMLPHGRPTSTPSDRVHGWECFLLGMVHGHSLYPAEPAAWSRDCVPSPRVTQTPR